MRKLGRNNKKALWSTYSMAPLSGGDKRNELVPQRT